MSATGDRTPVVTGLYYYPVKSLAGIPVAEAEFTQRGIANDRMWMLVRESGRFITQRDEHRLALLRVAPVGDGFVITTPNDRTTLLPAHCDPERSMIVDVWKDTLRAAMGPADAVSFFSDFLGYSCVPVFMDETADRGAGEYAPPTTPLSFADAYPGLLTTESSLRELNERTPIPIEMRRFRPNVVVAGGLPYDEDTWARVNLGSVEIQCVKPCARCVLTTVDPDTGDAGKEPLKTLAAYRRIKNDVYFGQNFVVSTVGRVKRGDRVSVVQRKEALFPSSG